MATKSPLPVILVVEDPPVSRRVIEETLPSSEFEVRWARGAGDAVSALQGGAVELVVVDDSDTATHLGMEVLKFLTEKDPFERPAIVMTADPRVTMAVSYLKIGAFDYLRKPLQGSEFRKAVDKILKGMHFRKPAGGAVPLPESTRLALSQYQINGVIGEGRMGLVLAATRESDDLPVAVKILKMPALNAKASAAEWATRFQIEAAAVARIDHPNVIRVLEYGYDLHENIPYMVMEFVRGDSLEVLMREGGIGDLGCRVGIVRDIAAALVAVHEKNMQHRDVKPANILISDEGEVKLTDFGVVHVPESTLTQAGHRIGSPFYMSPESCVQSTVDATSDLFSLGILAYELLLDASPFRRGSIGEFVTSVQDDAPAAPQAIQPGFSGELQWILGGLLRKNPSQRTQSATEVVEQLDTWLKGKSVRSLWQRLFSGGRSPWR